MAFRYATQLTPFNDTILAQMLVGCAFRNYHQQCQCRKALIHINPYYLNDGDNDYGLADELSVCAGTIEHYGYHDHFNSQIENASGDKKNVAEIEKYAQNANTAE